MRCAYETKPSIEDLMKYIENTVAGYFYSHFNGYEVMYKGTDDAIWKYRKITKENNQMWRIFKVDNTVDLFNRMGFDLAQFQKELTESCLNIAINCRFKLSKIEQLLSKELIDKAEADFRVFGKELGKIIGKEIKKKKFTILDGE